MEFRLLKADEIECRVSTAKDNGVSLLLYKDARVDQNILDETVGNMNWQRKHEVINGNLFCSVGIFCERIDDPSEWIWKQDVGVESYTEKEKGQASDAFKRACFNWGIGRELYTAPFIWISKGDVNLKENNGKYTTYDRFEVKEIGYTDRKITKLVIYNRNFKRVVYNMADAPKTESLISTAKINVLKADVKNGVIDEEALFKYFKVTDYKEITEEQFKKYAEKKKEKA